MIRDLTPAVPGPLRGVSRSSRYVGHRMRWTLWRQAGSFTPGETRAAYREVVWSWRRDPGVKSMERSIGDGGKKGRSPGRARISALKPLRGESRCELAEPVVTMSVSFL